MLNHMIKILDYKKGLLDFHNHSTYSDGGDTPTQLVARAKKQGVSAMALTDHHVMGGLPEFRNACQQYDIFAIPFGMEISVEFPQEALEKRDNEAPDMVILGKNPRNIEAKVQGYQIILQKDRANRFLPETFERLNEMGFYVPQLSPDVKTANAEKLGRLLADMVRNLTKGDNPKKLVNHVQSINPFIKREDIEKQPLKYVTKYVLAIGQQGYVKRFEGFSVSDARTLAEDMRCRLFIAHPGGEYGFLSDSMLEYFIQEKVHGIEIRNYFNTPEQNKNFDFLAEKYNLIRSGGSDCHGDNGPFKIGIYDRPQNQVPKEVLEELWDNLPD